MKKKKYAAYALGFLVFCASIPFLNIQDTSAKLSNRVSAPTFKKDILKDCVEIKLERPVDLSWFDLKSRNQIVVNLKDTYIQEKFVIKNVDSKMVKSIRASQHENDIVRIELQLHTVGPYTFRPSQRFINGSQVVSLTVSPHGGGLSNDTGVLLADERDYQRAELAAKRTDERAVELAATLAMTGKTIKKSVPAQKKRAADPYMNLVATPEFKVQGNEEQVVIKLNHPVDLTWSEQKSLNRIVVDIKDSFLLRGSLTQEINSSTIKAIHATQTKENSVQLVLDISPDTDYNFSTAQRFFQGSHILSLNLGRQQIQEPTSQEASEFVATAESPDYTGKPVLTEKPDHTDELAETDKLDRTDTDQSKTPKPAVSSPPLATASISQPNPRKVSSTKKDLGIIRLMDPLFENIGNEENILVKLNHPVATTWYQTAPDRVVVHFRNAVLPDGPLTKELNSGNIKSIQATQPGDDSVKMVLNLNPKGAYEFSTAQSFVKGSHVLSLCVGSVKPMTGELVASESTFSKKASQADFPKVSTQTKPVHMTVNNDNAMSAIRVSATDFKIQEDEEQVLITLSRPVNTNWFTLKSPDRLVVDIKNAYLPEKQMSRQINSKNIKLLRAAQNKKDVVRVVLDLQPNSNYNFTTAQGIINNSNILSLCLNSGDLQDFPAKKGGEYVAATQPKTKPATDITPEPEKQAREANIIAAAGTLTAQKSQGPSTVRLSEPLVDSRNGEENILIKLDHPVDTTWYAQTSPNQIIVDIIGAVITEGVMEKATHSDKIKAISATQTGKTNVQLVLELEPGQTWDFSTAQGFVEGSHVLSLNLAPQISQKAPHRDEAEFVAVRNDSGPLTDAEDRAKEQQTAMVATQTQAPETLVIASSAPKEPQADIGEPVPATDAIQEEKKIQEPKVAEVVVPEKQEETSEEKDIQFSGLVQARGTLQTSQSDSVENNTSLRNRVIIGASYKDTVTVSAISDYLYFGEDDQTDAYDADIYEAKLQYDSEHFGVCLGKQIIRWGKTDRISPVDTLNPQDRREYIIPDYEERKIPAWMADAKYHTGNFTVEGVVIPFFEESKQDYFQTNWSTFGHLKENVANSNLPGTIKNYIDNMTVNEKDPDNETEWGLRLTTEIKNMDIGLTYHYTTEDTPFYSDFAGLSADNFAAFNSAVFTDPSIEVEYLKTNIAGLEFGTTLAGIGIKGEAAWNEHESFLTDALTSVRKSTQTYVLEADYTTKGSTYLNFQVAHRHVADFDPSIMYAQENQTSLLGEVRINTFSDKLQACLKYTKPLENDSFYLNPYLKMNYIANVECRIGANIFSGDTDTELGRFEDRDVYYLDVRYQF